MKRFICELPVGPFRIALFDTDEILDEGECLAHWDPDALEIVLSADLDGQRRWSVLFHELTHALSDLYDLDIDEEHTCSVIGNGLTQALARFLSHPPTPPRPLPMDDEPTPTTPIAPITRAEQMK